MLWEDVGKRIKALRCERKLTQMQFGKLIGKSGQYVGKIENGQKISVELIAVICKKTGVTTDYIIFGIIDPLSATDLLRELSHDQIAIGFEVLKKLAEFIHTDLGNELLIKQVMAQQSQTA